MIYIFFSPQPEEQLACTFSHGVQFLLGIATEIVIVTISVPIPRKGRNRSISTHSNNNIMLKRIMLQIYD